MAIRDATPPASECPTVTTR